jgi:hypothetical protein
VRKVSKSPIMTLSQRKGMERILQKDDLQRSNAPDLQQHPSEKYGKNPMERILFFCKTRIVVPKTRVLVVDLFICC